MMDPLVQTLILKRFRSIPSECVHFDNPTFLVGRNGSGKSNLVAALDFMAEAMTVPLQAVFDKRGGISLVRNRTAGRSYPPNLGLGVVFGRINSEVIRARYAFEVLALKNYGLQVFREQCVVYGPENQRHFFDRIKGRFSSNVKGIKPALDPPSLALPVVAGEARFAPVLRTLAAMHTYAIDPGKLREMQDPDSGLSLRSDGSNVASVLKEIRRQAPEDITRIGELLASIVPNTTRVKPINHGNKLSLKSKPGLETRQWNYPVWWFQPTGSSRLGSWRRSSRSVAFGEYRPTPCLTRNRKVLGGRRANLNNGWSRDGAIPKRRTRQP